MPAAEYFQEYKVAMYFSSLSAGCPRRLGAYHTTEMVSCIEHPGPNAEHDSKRAPLLQSQDSRCSPC
eukprot:294050-Pelagomonas_calceolata.AAC.1